MFLGVTEIFHWLELILCPDPGDFWGKPLTTLKTPWAMGLVWPTGGEQKARKGWCNAIGQTTQENLLVSKGKKKVENFFMVLPCLGVWRAQ